MRLEIVTGSSFVPVPFTLAGTRERILEIGVTDKFGDFSFIALVGIFEPNRSPLATEYSVV